MRRKLKIWLVDHYCHGRLPKCFVQAAFFVFRLRHV